MNKSRYVSLAAVLALYAAASVAAPGPEHDKGRQVADKARQSGEKARKMAEKDDKFHKSNQQQGRKPEGNQAGIAVVLSSSGLSVTQAQQLVRQYQVSGGRQLPPGIRKQLARGKPLPPGIAKKVSQPDFLAALPQHQGYEWQICGEDLVLVAVATAVIAEVLSDVF